MEEVLGSVRSRRGTPLASVRVALERTTYRTDFGWSTVGGQSTTTDAARQAALLMAMTRPRLCRPRWEAMTREPKPVMVVSDVRVAARRVEPRRPATLLLRARRLFNGTRSWPR